MITVRLAVDTDGKLYTDISKKDLTFSQACTMVYELERIKLALLEQEWEDDLYVEENNEDE